MHPPSVLLVLMLFELGSPFCSFRRVAEEKDTPAQNIHWGKLCRAQTALSLDKGLPSKANVPSCTQRTDQRRLNAFLPHMYTLSLAFSVKERLRGS